MPSPLKIILSLYVIGLLLAFLHLHWEMIDADRELIGAQQDRITALALSEKMIHTRETQAREARFSLAWPNSWEFDDDIGNHFDILKGIPTEPSNRNEKKPDCPDGNEDTHISLTALPNANSLILNADELALLNKIEAITEGLSEMEQGVIREHQSNGCGDNSRKAAIEKLMCDRHLAAEHEADHLMRLFQSLVDKRTHEAVTAATQRKTRARRKVLGSGGLFGLTAATCFLFWFRRLGNLNKQIREDSLTRLGNREYLYRYLNVAAAKAEAHGEIILLAFLDLNGFKAVNDHYGHKRGDEVLQAISNSLRRHCRSHDVVVRYGGDEFVVVFISPMNRRHQTIERMRSVIMSSMRDIVNKPGFDEIGMAAGISILPSPSKTVGELIHSADKAMYEAKKLGKKITICVHHADQTIQCICTDSEDRRA